MSSLTGLSAFPLTPLSADRFEEGAYSRLIGRLVEAGVDSIGALGSTGSYAYLEREERRAAARAAVESAGDVPVIVGIGALRTSQVLALAEDAQEAGAAGVLLAPVSYQQLTEDEVFGLYSEVDAELSVPLVVYDNPDTTHFASSFDLYARLAQLDRVAAIKIPPPPTDPEAAAAHVARVRDAVGPDIVIGVSGDPSGAAGLVAGCDAWYSTIAGTLPAPIASITRAALRGETTRALTESERLAPLWELFAVHGSLRVAATVAEYLGLVPESCLPRPLLGLDADARSRVARVADDLGLR